MHQLPALRKHSCKPLCSACSNVIVAHVEVSQLPTLTQHSYNPLCPDCSETRFATEVKVHQRWSLRQHSCKTLCICSFHFTLRQLECCDSTPDCHRRELPQNEL